ncbi:hypothetical protein BX667DRAFT_459901, partial [Coemansia mojavensis]
YRKLRLSSYSNNEQVDARFVRSIKHKFGKNPKPTFIYGDWPDFHMKHNKPIRGVRMCDILYKHVFTVYLIEEYRTSSLCPLCFSPTEVFFKRSSPKPSKKQ